MGKFLRPAAIIITLICCYLPGFSQGSTSKGTEFWTAYMDDSNPPGTDGGSVMYLYITSNVNTTGTVALQDGSFTQTFAVTANQITTITVPPSAFLNAQGITNKGIHITSAQPIAVYAHIFANNSSGATLLLPVSTLGKDYYSINYTQRSNEQKTYSEFMVIATEDNTTIEITPTVPLIDGTPAGKPFNVVLNKGQVYQGLAATDLTGTRIRSISSATSSCTKIAVFAGSMRVQIGCNSILNSSDNLFQQVYPTASWGRNYITVPLKNRNYDIFRIVLSDPATKVVLNGATISAASFANGLYYEFNSETPNVITANKPIQVIQYAVTQGNTLNCGNDASDIGDPEMIYLTPLEQTINQVTLFSASNYLILNSYINVLIKTSQVPSFILDGAHYGSFKTVPGNPLYSYAQISVASGTHSISAAVGFNAIAYGFGIHESYGYAAGTNLQDLNSFIALQPPGTNILQSNGCTDISYNLLLTLPYQPTSITWDPLDGSVPVTISNPVPQQIVQNGDAAALYLYKYPNSPVSNKSGTYKIQATAFDPNTDVCGSVQQYNLTYNITNPPIAKFAVGDACLGDSTAFTDISTIGVAIKSWAWNFGDGQISISQNPVHKYAKPGDYNVSLTITDVDSCSSVVTLPVHVSSKPVATFTTSAPNCVGQSIVFTDASVPTEGTIVKWIWNFGDGKIDTLKTKTPTISHIYNTAGKDTVKLTVISANGCISQPFLQPLIIDPLPIIDFELPDICAGDAFAQFTDKSTIADGSEADFTYLWDFGDPSANVSNPNTSTQKNPKHTYAIAANYNVTLTITSRYGCTVSKTKQLIVNGANPVANFRVENNNSCSSDAVIFDDNSHVDFGSIIRMVWYFDYNNQPADSTVYTIGNMPVDRKYSHSYGIFNTGSSQNHEVRLVVYSGNSTQSCSNVKDVTVTQIVNPIVTLLPLNDICQGANPVQLKVNTNGFTGTGVFSGPGVTAGGIFNPAIAGVGTTTINYVFTANGCSYSTSEQINVIADPTVSTDAVVNMLEGDQVTLKATASGNNLTYKWTPSMYLNRDDVLNPVVSATDNISYTLTVTSADDCTAQATVAVNVLKKLVIPSAFTPNGDNINDTWMIKYIEDYPGCTVDVFNRNGQKVFTSINYNEPWDGKYKGSYLPTGTYYYIINPKNGRTAISGPVTIIR